MNHGGVLLMTRSHPFFMKAKTDGINRKKKFEWLLAVKLPLFRYADALFNCEREFFKL